MKERCTMNRRDILRSILAAPAFALVPYEAPRPARRFVLSANTTLTLTSGGGVELRLLQDGAVGRSVTWPANFTWKGRP